MKRFLSGLALACLCMAPARARAQSFGVLVGPSWGSTPNENGALPGTLHANSGFALGVGVQSSSPLGFGFNALFAQRGFTSSATGYSQRLDYIDVPGYLRFAIPTPVVSPFVFAGPQVSFELNCTGGDCPSGRPSTTYAGVIGAGLKLHALGEFSVQGRYVYGLTNLDYNTISNSSNYKTRSFLLLVGLGL